MFFELAVGNNFIDLSQCASVVNRRFYRQGLNWAVQGFSLASAPAATGGIRILKLPNTWAVSNSWHKVYAAWKRQQDEAVKAAGAESAVATYRDFKISMDVPHHLGVNLLPLDAAGGAYKTGEWDKSQIVIPNDGGVVGTTAEYELHMVGPDVATSKGMIQNYALSRSVPHSPDPAHLAVEDSLFSEMFNVGMDDSEVVDNATDSNDHLPYDQDEYPGGSTNAPTLEVSSAAGVSATTIGNITRIAGSNFPCGLINVEVTGATLAGSALQIHLVPGYHRGYLAEPMQDM